MEQAVLEPLHNNANLIYLKGPEFSLGRALNNSYVFKELTVSRCHCVFKFEDNQWTVIDKSFNGTKINSKPVSKSGNQPVEHNDIIELNETIKYRFCYPYNTNENYSCKRRRVDNSSEDDISNPLNCDESKLASDNGIEDASSDNCEVNELKNELSREKAIIKKLKDDSKEMQSKIFGLEVDLFNKIASSVKLEQEIIDLKSSCANLEQERNDLQQQLSEYESETNLLRQRLEKSQAFDKLKTQTSKVDEEDTKLVRCVLRAEIHEKECTIKLKINHAISHLKNLSKKDNNFKQLETCLSELQSDTNDLMLKRSELDYNKSVQTSEDKGEKIKEDLFNIMETDLQCSICNELFIKATSLNCGHTFCKLCIEQWKKQKNTCPVCRIPIKNSIPCIAIDNYVDQSIELLSPNKKEIRAKLKESHEASTSKSNTNAREAISNRSPIYLSSDSESESEWDTEDFSDYSDGYYGGYGACYICGAPDHWANSCPQRRGGGGGRPRRR